LVGATGGGLGQFPSVSTAMSLRCALISVIIQNGLALNKTSLSKKVFHVNIILMGIPVDVPIEERKLVKIQRFRSGSPRDANVDVSLHLFLWKVSVGGSEYDQLTILNGTASAVS